MRRDVFEKLLSLPVGYFDVHQSGDIISRISYDIDTVNASLSDDEMCIRDRYKGELDYSFAGKES